MTLSCYVSSHITFLSPFPYPQNWDKTHKISQGVRKKCQAQSLECCGASPTWLDVLFPGVWAWRVQAVSQGGSPSHSSGLGDMNLGGMEQAPQAAFRLPPVGSLFGSKLKPKQKTQNISFMTSEGTVCLVSSRAACEYEAGNCGVWL